MCIRDRGLANNEAALKAQSAVTDMTNELLRKNAEKLKASTVEVARESERGIVDIETLKATNENLCLLYTSRCV